MKTDYRFQKVYHYIIVYYVKGICLEKTPHNRTDIVQVLMDSNNFISPSNIDRKEDYHLDEANSVCNSSDVPHVVEALSQIYDSKLGPCKNPMLQL